MPTLPSLEQWRLTMADMVLFHLEQGLPWLWLPTPSEWIEALHARQTPEQAALRKLQVMPSTPQPAGLTWHAWDTRSDDWVKDPDLLTRWYGHWVKAQATQPAQ